MLKFAGKPENVALAHPDTVRRYCESKPAACRPADRALVRPWRVRRKGPLRVLQLINYLGRGGTELGVMKLMAGLTDGLFEHTLCTIRGFDTDWGSPLFAAGKLLVAGRPDLKSQFLFFRFVRIMKAYRPHIVHSRNWFSLEAVPAARLLRIPVAIHSEHGYGFEMLREMPIRRRLLRRGIYAMADAVLTVSQDLRRYHAEQAWMPLERVRVIPNGVDTQRFSPRPDIRPSLRKQFGLPAESFVVGSVGRMVPIKDQSTLLKAAEILALRGEDIRVLLVGSGPELIRLQRYVESSAGLSGRVLFVGSTDHVPELLNVMDVFVLPSICEGMSNTLLEAMASGLPVVATRVGGNPEVVEEDRSGWLFLPGDVEDLAGRLQRLACHREVGCKLGAAARQRAIEHFSLERMLEDYRNLYLELADRHGLLARG